MSPFIPALAVVILTGCSAVQREPDVEKHPWSDKTIVFSNDPKFPDRILLNYSYACPASGGTAASCAAACRNPRKGNIRFRDVAGKKAVVEGSRPSGHLSGSGTSFRPSLKTEGIDGSLRMKFSEEDKYICYDLRESFRDVKENKPPKHAFFEKDIENISKMKGKTVWAKGFYINTVKTDYHKGRMINSHNTAPLVITGLCPPTPYHFFVEVENSKNQKGCIPLDNRLDLEAAFFIKNPIDPGWDKETLDAVRTGSFFIGMPAGALEISWGKPREINRTFSREGVHEQWIYGDWGPYIYLDNGKVVSREK